MFSVPEDSTVPNITRASAERTPEKNLPEPPELGKTENVEQNVHLKTE